MLESQPSSTPRLSAASSARKGRWVRHHQTEDTLPKKKQIEKQSEKWTEKQDFTKNSLESTFLRILIFLVIFDLFLTLFFREKQNEKQNEKQPKNATVNYPNICGLGILQKHDHPSLNLSSISCQNLPLVSFFVCNCTTVHNYGGTFAQKQWDGHCEESSMWVGILEEQDCSGLVTFHIFSLDNDCHKRDCLTPWRVGYKPWGY